MTIHYLRVSISAILLTLTTLVAIAKDSPAKFGKITKADFADKVCPIDSSAHAYYIFNNGQARFTYSSIEGKGFQLVTTKHFRIKFIDNQGFDWANVSIPLFYRGGTAEKVSKVKGYTYNLEDGKIVKTKLSKDAILTEEVRKNWRQEKLAMPNVKEGSIIEIEYTVVSDYYFNLSSWNFQKSIPVLQSDFEVYIPEYYEYKHTLGGYIDVARRDLSRPKTLMQKTRNSNGQLQSYSIPYQETSTLYSAKNVLPFVSESYLRSSSNYISKVDFELRSTNFPGNGPQNYTSTWTKIDHDLNIDPDLGLALKKDNHLNEIAESIKGASDDEMVRAKMALEIIKQKIKWNGSYGQYCYKSLSRIYKDGSGNSGEVNLNLVALLRLLELDANPVLLSTQSNGIIRTYSPSISSFNYLIATAKIGDKNIILDATDSDSEINIVPYRDLNYKGRVITPTRGYWLDLEGYAPSVENTFYSIKLNENLEAEGQVQKRYTGYAAYDRKKIIDSYKDLDEYQEKFESEDEGLTLDSLKVTNLDNINKGVILKADLTDTDFIEGSADMVYIPTIIEPFLSSNPFKLEKREYPVEFDTSTNEKYTCNLSIPEGYQIAEIPKPVAIANQDKSIIFKYQVVGQGANASINTSLVINKTIFLPSEYDTLKQIFQLIYDTQEQMIVIKKI